MQGAQAFLGIVEQQQQPGVAVGDLGRQVIDRLRGFLDAGSRGQGFADFIQRRQLGIALFLPGDNAGILNRDSGLMDERGKQLDVGCGQWRAAGRYC